MTLVKEGDVYQGTDEDGKPLTGRIITAVVVTDLSELTKEGDAYYGINDRGKKVGGELITAVPVTED